MTNAAEITGYQAARGLRDYYTGTVASITYTEATKGALTASITFDPADLDALVAEIDDTKAAHVSDYLRNGGNPRNKRGISTQYAAIKRAINLAAAR